MKRIILLFLVTGFSVLADQENKNEVVARPAALTEARKAIDKGNAQWIEAWDKADASLIAKLFTEDGVLLGRSGKLFKGPQQIFERQKKVMEGAGKGVKATVTTVDVWLDVDIAYETGKYSYKFQEKGQAVTEEGRYVTIWKRQNDGSWKILADMGVSND
ncbi:MAG TPA: nuclear transport factor 2 family protein [Chthoniobacterales bacterium]|nr:nuclear transport factor 2 family protein [Chthoniobacterales bacterium]